jgi:cation diffusion facilitator CzcD-associated flavoprotein CzcO
VKTEQKQSIKKPNVKLVKASVTSLTETGCVDEFGTAYDADIIICATGFDTSFRPRFSIIGQGGIDLRDVWNTTNPECYLGLAVHGMPNLMMYVSKHVLMWYTDSCQALGSIHSW